MQLIAWWRGRRARAKLRELKTLLHDHRCSHVVVAVQSRRDSAWEMLTHICAGLGYQLACEFLIAPAILAAVYDFRQAMVNVLIYVPVRYAIGYALRRRFVDIIKQRWTPIPTNKRDMIELITDRDDRVFAAELGEAEQRKRADNYRDQLVALVGADLVGD